MIKNVFAGRGLAGVCAAVLLLLAACHPKVSNSLKKKDLRSDVEVITDKGTLVIRLSDSTPQHRDNFLRLVKSKYYDSLLFHRVIRNFMIQSGDPNSREGRPGKPLSQGGSGGPNYTIPAEIRATLFHKRGALGAARTGDDVNPTRASSGSQFYIVQGKKFTEAGLDSLEKGRLKGRRIPSDEREVYKEIGGAPHLDQAYTVFGEVVRGMEVVDSVAAVRTSGAPLDRPVEPVRILKMRLIRRSDRSVK
ncbi:MAG: peptidylprolyl isomerase [Bacteroidetes bacterium]|nr:peptidylprolyl isomerase [Bacteroidota bacterium]